MKLIRTTLRLQSTLKKAAEKQALAEETTFQDILARALAAYLKTSAKTRARKIVFKTHDLGVPLDGLRRDEYYPSV